MSQYCAKTNVFLEDNCEFLLLSDVSYCFCEFQVIASKPLIINFNRLKRYPGVDAKWIQNDSVRHCTLRLFRPQLNCSQELFPI